jgi:hypothetical protein
VNKRHAAKTIAKLQTMLVMMMMSWYYIKSKGRYIVYRGAIGLAVGVDGCREES